MTVNIRPVRDTQFVHDWNARLGFIAGVFINRDNRISGTATWVAANNQNEFYESSPDSRLVNDMSFTIPLEHEEFLEKWGSKLSSPELTKTIAHEIARKEAPVNVESLLVPPEKGRENLRVVVEK